MTGKQEELWIGPQHRYEPRQAKEDCDVFRLGDGRPLWYACLYDPNALVMTAADADRARSELRRLFRMDPGLVRGCIGGSLEEIQQRLRVKLSAPGLPPPKE